VARLCAESPVNLFDDFDPPPGDLGVDAVTDSAPAGLPLLNGKTRDRGIEPFGDPWGFVRGCGGSWISTRGGLGVEIIRGNDVDLFPISITGGAEHRSLHLDHYSAQGESVAAGGARERWLMNSPPVSRTATAQPSCAACGRTGDSRPRGSMKRRSLHLFLHMNESATLFLVKRLLTTAV
jgi:hypothetical protein